MDSQDAEKHSSVCATYEFLTCAQQLVKDDSGRVTGVAAKENGSLVYYEGTKAIVICTGGSTGDLMLRAAFEDRLLASA